MIYEVYPFANQISPGLRSPIGTHEKVGQIKPSKIKRHGARPEYPGSAESNSGLSIL